MQLVLATSSSRCVSSSLDTSPECMDDFASSQPENRYTVVAARDTLEHLELSARRMKFLSREGKITHNDLLSILLTAIMVWNM